MERILYIWAIRHPASGYVQGINDLLTPLYVVFLSAHVGELAPLPIICTPLPTALSACLRFPVTRTVPTSRFYSNAC